MKAVVVENQTYSLELQHAAKAHTDAVGDALHNRRHVTADVGVVRVLVYVE